MTTAAEAILTLDVGTTQAKAMIFGPQEQILARASCNLSVQRQPSGWVEQDPQELLAAGIQVMRQVLEESGERDRIKGFCLANQRETLVAWDSETGMPVYPAISWEDNRLTTKGKRIGQEKEREVREITGLSVKSDYTAIKINWLLTMVEEAQRYLSVGRLRVGTVDSWLMYKLLVYQPHFTDWTNASRTLLFDLKTKNWSEQLMSWWQVPRQILPEVKPSVSKWGMLNKGWLGKTWPLLAVAGDQQASLAAVGEESGSTKVTYGTGTFIMQVMGKEWRLIPPFLTTLTVGGNYALEAKIARGGKEVEPLLAETGRLKEYLKGLVEEVNLLVKQLPIEPQEIVIDGGVARDEYAFEFQQQISTWPIRKQDIFDGTSLGIARVIRSLVKG